MYGQTIDGRIIELGYPNLKKNTLFVDQPINFAWTHKQWHYTLNNVSWVDLTVLAWMGQLQIVYCCDLELDEEKVTLLMGFLCTAFPSLSFPFPCLTLPISPPPGWPCLIIALGRIQAGTVVVLACPNTPQHSAVGVITFSGCGGLGLLWKFCDWELIRYLLMLTSPWLSGWLSCVLVVWYSGCRVCFRSPQFSLAHKEITNLGEKLFCLSDVVICFLFP